MYSIQYIHTLFGFPLLCSSYSQFLDTFLYVATNGLVGSENQFVDAIN